MGAIKRKMIFTMIFNLFALLSETRRAATKKELFYRLRQREIRFNNGPAFWIRLCQANALLTNDELPKPTGLCARWLSWNTGSQYKHLLNGWCQMVRSKDTQSRRVRLSNALLILDQKEFKALLKTPAYQRELPAIEHLNLSKGDQFTDQARLIFSEKVFSKQDGCAWQLDKEFLRLHVTLPTDLRLLWQLEQYVSHLPHQSGTTLVYSLHPKDIRLTSQQYDIQKKLFQILSKGLQKNIDEVISGLDYFTSKIKYERGYLLTFCKSAELAALRQDQRLRKALEQILSTNHIFVPKNLAGQAFKALADKGLVKIPEEIQNEGQPPNMQLQANTLCELLTLAWFAQIEKLPIALSGKALATLVHQLPYELALLCLQRVENYLMQSSQFTNSGVYYDSSDDDPEIITAIKKAIHELNSLTIAYKKPGGSKIDYRVIAPLLLEKNGPNIYLIAFCEKRCARRTFRIDRIISISTQLK
jgi:hypothetical protein